MIEPASPDGPKRSEAGFSARLAMLGEKCCDYQVLLEQPPVVPLHVRE
jgi:hypothetical protein